MFELGVNSLLLEIPSNFTMFYCYYPLNVNTQLYNHFKRPLHSCLPSALSLVLLPNLDFDIPH